MDGWTVRMVGRRALRSWLSAAWISYLLDYLHYILTPLFMEPSRMRKITNVRWIAGLHRACSLKSLQIREVFSPWLSGYQKDHKI